MATTVEDIQRWMTPQEAALKLRMSKTNVLWLIAKGQVESIRTPLGHLINPVDCERVAQEREAKAKA